MLCGLTKVRDERESLCADLFHLPIKEGRPILCEVFLGSKIPSHLSMGAQPFLQEVEMAGRLWRWLAITVMPREFSILREDTTVSWAETSVVAHLYF